MAPTVVPMTHPSQESEMQTKAGKRLCDLLDASGIETLLNVAVSSRILAIEEQAATEARRELLAKVEGLRIARPAPEETQWNMALAVVIVEVSADQAEAIRRGLPFELKPKAVRARAALAAPLPDDERPRPDTGAEEPGWCGNAAPHGPHTLSEEESCPGVAPDSGAEERLRAAAQELLTVLDDTYPEGEVHLSPLAAMAAVRAALHDSAPSETRDQEP
jgi:hypothetical protein